MPRTPESDSDKRQKVIYLYKGEFYETKTKLLWCRCCNISVNYSKKSYVDQYRRTDGHKRKQNLIVNTPTPMENITDENFKTDLIQAFLKADIPLHKLRNMAIKEFFGRYSLPLPSQSHACKQVKEFADRIKETIIRKLQGKYIYLVIDESNIRSKYIVNVLVGDIKDPNKSYLISCDVRTEAVNSDYIIRTVDSIMIKNNFPRENLCLILSDAATYMTKAANFLSVLFPNLFHITCLSHLIHNCCLKTKNFYESINKLITAMKNLITKNLTRRKLFKHIGIPPMPVVTRWSSWLTAANYYFENFTQIKMIVENINTTGKIVESAKLACNQENIQIELIQIHGYYKVLFPVATLLEEKKLNVQHGLEVLMSMRFENDEVGIRKYLDKRLANNGIYDIFNWRIYRPDIKLEIIESLISCQCTSVDVERSFSLLNNLLNDNRDFADENIKYYIMNYYNKDV